MLESIKDSLLSLSPQSSSDLTKTCRKSGREDIELVLAIMVDVAAADDDGVEPVEVAVIRKLAQSVGVSAPL